MKHLYILFLFISKMVHKKYAILVIDVQNDFWSEKGLFAKKE